MSATFTLRRSFWLLVLCKRSPSSRVRGSEGAGTWDADDQGSRTVWKTRAKLHSYRRRHGQAQSGRTRPQCCLKSQEATSGCSV